MRTVLTAESATASPAAILCKSVPTWNFAVLVDAIAREVPEREAIVHGTRRITWHEFASSARAFAWRLHTEAGLAPGDKVVIALPNCPAYIESYVGVRKVRGVPLNVSPGVSADALHKLVDASDAKVVVCSPATAEAARAATRRIQKRWRPKVVVVTGSFERDVDADGPPAEWAIEQPSADDLIFLATRDEIPASAVLPIVLALAPLSSGNCLATALRALTAGGCVVFVDSATFDPPLVWQTIEHEHVDTVAIAGDPFARPLLTALQAATAPLPLTTLRTISSSGAPLGPDVVEGLRAELRDVAVIDAYEGLDHDAPVTATKVRPAEVEARLLKHRSISDCVVIGVSDPRIGKKVVALVQVESNHFLDGPELTAWCRARLPSTMTPGAFVFVETIERSESGATNYDALRRLTIDRLVDEQ